MEKKEKKTLDKEALCKRLTNRASKGALHFEHIHPDMNSNIQYFE